MKKSLSSLFIAVILGVTVSSVHAAEAVSEAIVLSVKGGAQATLPGQKAPVAIKAGDKLPQGTVIQTPGNAEVEIQAFSGSTSTIQPGAKVELSKLSLTTSNGVITKQTAVIDLTVGSVVSSLDPAKKAINDYSIRTPKGVAAARGTKYVVTVTASGKVTTYVTTGVVIFTNPVTGQSVSVQPGYVVVVDTEGKISEPVKATAEQRALAKEIEKEEKKDDAGKDDVKDRAPVVDITIVSPSS